VIGETIGSYRVVQELGSGGMGAVYLGEHRRLGRKAAIKILRREYAQRTDLLERFFAEARATSVIDHPGIVQILDCDIDPNGQPFIVMEYLAGETLGAYLRRVGVLSASRAAGMARRMAEALGAAHGKGIIHRDVKPDNAFVVSDDPPAIKLLDFGIAKLAAELSGGTSVRTQTGIMMGTPLYMSPEQCRGAGAVDHRADIYSLGCILFEMLCGRPPFVYEGMGELVAAHLTQTAPSVNSLNQDVMPALDVFVHRMLQKAPADRPQTMADAAATLTAFETHTSPASGSSAVVARPARAQTGSLLKSGTTLGETASQILTPGVDSHDGRDLGQDGPPPRHLPVVPLAAAAAVIAGVAALIWTRGRTEAPDPAAVTATVTTAPAAKAVPPTTSAPYPSPAPPPTAPARATTAVANTATTSAPPRPSRADRQTIRLNVSSTPPGARVCLDQRPARRTIPATGMSLPRDGQDLVVLVHLLGYKVERLVVPAVKDISKNVPLTRLGPDDLIPEPPCPE